MSYVNPHESRFAIPSLGTGIFGQNDWAESVNKAVGISRANAAEKESQRQADLYKQQQSYITAGNAAAKTADPWASQRGQYQTSLSQLMQNPGGAMQNNPFFKWQQDQGLDAVNRKMAASGGRVSGNRMMALSDYAQNQSGQNFFQLADLYSLLGGAQNQNPAMAAQLQYRGFQDAAKFGLENNGGIGRTITQSDHSNFRPGYFV
jgi:hypothetical protein